MLDSRAQRIKFLKQRYFQKNTPRIPIMAVSCARARALHSPISFTLFTFHSRALIISQFDPRSRKKRRMRREYFNIFLSAVVKPYCQSWRARVKLEKARKRGEREQKNNGKFASSALIVSLKWL